MVHFLKKICLAIALFFSCSGAFAAPPVYGPLQAQNNLDDVDNSATSLANLGGLSSATAASTYAPLANPTFTGTVTIPTIAASGGAINGTSIGGTTASTGAFSTLSASSMVSGAGFSTYLASPPAIGGTAPASGKFTTLQSTSTVTGIGLIGVQVFTASGTYTPDAQTQAIIVEDQAQGGGGGGCASTTSSQNCIAQSGGAGSYAKVYYSSGITTETVTITNSGAGGAAGDNPGTSGGTSSFGSLVSCPGGNFGAGGAAFTDTTFTISAGSGRSSACTISGGTTISTSTGFTSSWGVSLGTLATQITAVGANSLFGSGGGAATGDNAGVNAAGYGAGGSGGASSNGTSQIGGNPSGGLIIVYEYN